MVMATVDEAPLYDDPVVQAAQVADCLTQLDAFLKRYQPLVARAEQAAHLQVYVEGLLSNLERKSIEPIATAHGLYRRPLQHFVGAGKWQDTAVRTELRDHVVSEIAAPEGVLVIDGSGFHKTGPESCGVARQWCGRLGKIENCQVGVFLAYATPRGATLVDAELYLPADWTTAPARRPKTHVPKAVEFQTAWQLADAMLVRNAAQLPHAWIVGDDEYGRPSAFRDRLADRDEHYLLEVPSNTLVRRPPDWPGRSAKWHTALHRKKRRPHDRWKRFVLRDGHKGPIEVFAFATRVQTKRKDADGKVAPPREEVLLVMEKINGSQTWYFLAPKGTPLDSAALVKVAAHRHSVEEVFEAAKGEVGFDHYEVRSYVGWHHHMTLSMLALWFLVVERRRLGKKLLH